MSESSSLNMEICHLGTSRLCIRFPLSSSGLEKKKSLEIHSGSYWAYNINLQRYARKKSMQVQTNNSAAMTFPIDGTAGNASYT